MTEQSSFEKSVQQIKEARKELDKGFCCECGGIMKARSHIDTSPGVDATVYTCHENGKFVDKYPVKCNKCGKEDFFVAPIKHLKGKIFE